jgi:DNA-binding YbaB/EbfC family protein
MMNMQKMLKQIQKVQEAIIRVQEELKEERVEATVGGGAVRVVANGHGDLLQLHIDPSMVNPEDVEVLEDLIVAAVNEARRQARELSSKKMEEASGVKLPGLF